MAEPQKPVQNAKIVKTALSMIEDGVRWPEIKMADILAAMDDAGAPAAQALFMDKNELFSGLFTYIDRQTEDSLDSAILSESPRDRLFEIMMARFDVLNEHGGAWRHLFYETFKDPDLFRRALPRVHASVEVMLRLADLNGRDHGGILPLRTGATALVYLNALRVWLNDHSPDMAKTMAELDRGLARLERTLDIIPAPLKQFI